MTSAVRGAYSWADLQLYYPCLKIPNMFWTRGSTFSFWTGSCKLCSWSWAPGEMLLRKETFSPSHSFLPYQIYQQILLPFPPISNILTPTIALSYLYPPPPPPILGKITVLEPNSMVVFQWNFIDKTQWWGQMWSWGHSSPRLDYLSEIFWILWSIIFHATASILQLI